MSENDTIQSTPVSVGEKLKTLRESRDIGALEIAAKMHLDIRVINAIEDNDYKSLPYPIYIRGYIRSYSKLVGGDADELVRLFEESVGVQDPEIIPEIKYPSQSSSSDKPVKAFTYLIILGLVVLVIAWWQSNYIIDLQPDSGNAVPSSDMVTSIDIGPQDLPVVTPTYSQQTALQTPVELLDIDEFSPEPFDDGVSDITATDIIADTQLDTEAVTSTATDVLTTEETQAGTPVLESVAPVIAAADQGIPPATNGPDSLVVSLTADSWIEITDVNNQKLFMDLARTGSTLNLRGTAPFEILLGFAQGVTLEFNGTPFDIAPYSRAGVAKFTLVE